MSVPNGNFFVNCVRNIKNFNLTEEIAANLNEEKYKESVCVCARAPLCVCEKTLLPVVGGLEVEWMRRSEESRLCEVCG